jgi:hypothetical protein
MMAEKQNTTTNGEMITGELVFHFENVPIGDFLRYRAKVREIVGFGNAVLIRSSIEEKALINENNLERRPEVFKEAQQPPMPQEFGGSMAIPAQRLPGQPKKEKKPYIHSKMRGILAPLVGADQQIIIQMVKSKVKKTKYTDAEIMEMYNTIHRIR